MNLSSLQNPPKTTTADDWFKSCHLFHKNYHNTSSYSYSCRNFIVSVARLGKTPIITRRRRRRNHLRRKLQEQVPTTTTTTVVVVEKESLNPVLVNQLETWAAKSSSSVLPLHNNNNNNNPVVVINQDPNQILTTTNLIQQHKLLISPSAAAFLLFIAFTSASFFTATKKRHIQKDNISRLDKEMLTRKFRARKHQIPPDNSTVQVILQDSKPHMIPPQLDKQHLINTILNSNSHFHAQIQEITTMARHARQIEKQITIAPKHTSVFHDTSDSTPLNTEGKGNIGNSHVSMPENKTSNLLDTEKLVQKKPAAGRIITSVKEARQYLNNKKPEFNQLPNIPNTFDFSAPTSNDTNLGENGNVSVKNTNVKEERVTANAAQELQRANRDKWMEDNFHEFQPLVDKIRGGFTNNYKLAKEKVKEDVDDIVSDLKMLQRDETETEFEWMKDEKLTEIVFQVRENELMGQDPFYLMDDQDKALFFKGLEKKVEKENEKLRHLHEYLHSNIENLDYGADGISLYDPPEKIIPRWKGPPPATTMSQEFLDDYLHQRKSLFAKTSGNSDLVKSDPQDSLQSTNKTVESKNLKSSKTVIEGSDGSVKPGKKSGKEFWQHTKKWSRGFIDSYNAENDPETKAVMKDIGKDLDRWITEKEIKATADIMDKVPDKGKKFIAEKINKLKTEMELFGPQAVVSKYSEYGEEEEMDYYWWLDLPFLLCIELYIDGDEDERIGFYSLEMASDLELDPKPHHIIAFEDAGDCKNFCYIIQAHMEMLGNGNAFVVPQLPKDTYQEAKTNGFNVTVIRKGELKLDVDQTLEEVEEKLVEIGSKMYHDKIMKGRNVDVDSVMKGVFGLNKSPKRSRSKKKLKKPIK